MNRIRARSARLSVTFFVAIVILASCRSKTPQHIPMGTAIPDNVILQNLTATQNVNSTSYVLPQSTSSATPPQMLFTSMGAQTGSGQFGPTMQFVSGTNDPNLGNASGHYFEFGAQLAPDGHDNSSGIVDWYQFMTLHSTGAGVVLGLCGGTDDDGAGCAGTEISANSQLSLATEKNSPILISPSNGSGNGQSTFIFSQTSGANLPMMQLSNNSGTQFPALSGMIALPWGNSTGGQELVDQRNSTNGTDLSIMSRQAGGALTYGSLNEDNQRYAAATCTSKVLSSTGTGFPFVGPNGTVADFDSDVQQSWVEGDVWPPTHDAWAARMFVSDSTTTSLQTIATIPIPSGTQAVTRLSGTLVARESSTGDFATFDLPHWTYVNNGGSITAPTGSEPAATDTGHTTGAGTSIAPQFSISGSTILLRATPWTTSAVHWVAHVEHTVDMAVQVTPTPPTGSVLWLRADKGVSLGALSNWLDQSGNGNNVPLQGGASAPTNTANVGPGGALPAVVFDGSTSQTFKLTSALGVGTTNYTIAVVAKTNQPTTGQTFIAIGAPSNGQSIGIGGAGRDFAQNGVTDITDGTATTNWEAWVFTSDASGNLSLLVNGASQSLSPSTSTAATPSADIAIGASVVFTSKTNGDIFEVLVWNTAQNNANVYAYQHAVTGL